MRVTYSCHILSSPSFIFLQAVEDCIDGATAAPVAVNCLDDCLHDDSITCDEFCGMLETCHAECFTAVDTRKAEIYDDVNCHLTETCICTAADDARPIESFALNLVHASKKNLRA